jgi:hypothetical protein
MSSKLITFALLFATGCTWGAEGYIGPDRGVLVGGPANGGGAILIDQHHTNGEGPIILDAYAECWQISGGIYGWYFDAAVEHSFGPEYVSEIESVWVDVYHPVGVDTFELFDIQSLPHSLAAPGASYYNYNTQRYDGVWMAAEYENLTSLLCDSNIPYDVYTTAYDFQGNYQTTVRYL